MQLASRSSCLLWLLFGLVLVVCQAQHPGHFEDVDDGGEGDAWQAGVYVPQALKPVPWAEPAAPPPAPRGGLVVPGVGELQGLRGFKTIKNRPIDAYLGVHYAQVGSGLERFQQAKPVPYRAYIDATQASPNCAQFPEQQRLREAEARGENVDDCLTLNVYAPSGARDLPVLVFVHGEMLFDGGAEEAQPDYVLEHDVVLVSINYRLAPFGFLSALSDELPGNVALSDLHLALEWVQRNIRYFGGAANQVTLVGQAGGATLAHALSLSPRTQHLFQQLILQSGTALNPYLIDERPLDTVAGFSRLGNCPSAGRNLAPIYECLRRLPTSQLVGIFEQLFQQNEPRGLNFLGGFKLVVGDRLGYLPEHPAALVANNNVTKPLIVGATKDASAFILSRFYDQIQRIQSYNISDYINVILRHTAPPQQHKVWHDWAIREIFTPDQLRYVNANSVSQGLLELANLILYRAPVIYSIRSAYKKSPTYLYSFDYRGQYHRFGHLSNPLPFGVDASLSDDSVYLFPYPEEASNLNPKDKSLSRNLVALWVNFAVSGVPSPAPNVWPRAASEYGPFLRVTNSDRNIIELDQHFGEGINVPNLYAQYSNTTNSTQAVLPTTRRPYYNVVRQPQLPQPPVNRQYPPNEDYYARALQQRRQQLLREQQARVLKQREQDEQQRNRLLREEEARRQREEQLRREQQRRAQLEYEQRQREQQAKEQQELLLQQTQEQQRKEQEQREQQRREQLQREQQEREQLLREQQEREREQQPQLSNSGDPIYNDYFRQQQQREEERLIEQREQEAREQQEREQQRREQLLREQEEREHQPHASENGNPTYEDYVRQQQEQQQREEERLKEEREQEAREQQEREQQRREQLLREQAEREQQPHQPESGNFTYEDYVRQQQEQQQREEERLIEEREQEAREQQEREQQRREQLLREQEERQQQPHSSEAGTPSYDDYDRQPHEQQEGEEERLKEEEQQRREQLEREQAEREHQPEGPEGSESESPTYEDYVRQQEEQQKREEERLKEEREQEAREQYEREQQKEREKQLREQLQREQQEREQQTDASQSGSPTYEDYVRQQEEQQQREQDRLNEEARQEEERQRQRQLQGEQEEGEQEPLFNYRSLDPTIIDHVSEQLKQQLREQLVRAQQERLQAERDQQARDQYAREQEQDLEPEQPDPVLRRLFH